MEMCMTTGARCFPRCGPIAVSGGSGPSACGPCCDRPHAYVHIRALILEQAASGS